MDISHARLVPIDDGLPMSGLRTFMVSSDRESGGLYGSPS